MSLGKQVRSLRKRHGITQRDLAHKLGITPAYISKIENDRLDILPSVTVLKQLEKELDAPTGLFIQASGKINVKVLQEVARQSLLAAKCLRRMQSGYVTPDQWLRILKVLES